MLSDANFAFLREVLRKESGLELSTDHQYLVLARLQSMLRERNLPDMNALVDALRTRRIPGLVDEIAERMTVNETLFFRDTKTFELLSKQVLPDLYEKNGRRPLSIWSAASSTGQEAYSMAITAKELNLPVSILGTDLSHEALKRAKAGRYPPHELKRGLSPALIEKYFQACGQGDFKVRPELALCADFQWLNLVGPWPSLPVMDLILIRNVLIYFQDDTKRYVLRKARDILRPSGYLLLGASEPTAVPEEIFKRAPFPGQAIFQKK